MQKAGRPLTVSALRSVYKMRLLKLEGVPRVSPSSECGNAGPRRRTSARQLDCHHGGGKVLLGKGGPRFEGQL